MAINKVVAAGGAATALAIGVLVGGIGTGLVGAQTPAAHNAKAHATPADAPESGADQPDLPGNDPATTPPAGSISTDQAKQIATTYVQQTAPYSSEGLTVQSVTVDDENGTILFSVDFSGANGAGVEVQVSTQGHVLGADNGSNDGAQGADHSDTGAAGLTDGPDAPGAAEAAD